MIALVEAKVEETANEKQRQQAHERCYVGQRHRNIAHLPERDRHRAVWAPIAAAADAERARQVAQEIARDRASRMAAVRGSGRPPTKGAIVRANALAKQGQIVEVCPAWSKTWCLHPVSTAPPKRKRRFPCAARTGALKLQPRPPSLRSLGREKLGHVRS